VDNLGAPTTERDFRYAYTLTAERILKNLATTDLPNVPDSSNFRDCLESALNWSDLEWVRSITNMPLVIKGIQTAEDARLCIEHGVDAILVSNHGGHTLLGTTGSINLLPEVMDVVGDRMDVLLDGGIRHGTDVLKSLALGAKAVFVGRAMFWGLAVDGENGVRRVLEILRDELDVAMGLCGVTDVNNVDKRLVAATNGRGSKSDVVGQLERLARLAEKGYLTREEFDAQKGKLLVP
jgi:isopentenyl diphosphate isomerase/L-lactate dehydrogenase-like FMN-dependent dehydrogenase